MKRETPVAIDEADLADIEAVAAMEHDDPVEVAEAVADALLHSAMGGAEPAPAPAPPAPDVAAIASVAKTWLEEVKVGQSIFADQTKSLGRTAELLGRHEHAALVSDDDACFLVHWTNVADRKGRRIRLAPAMRLVWPTPVNVEERPYSSATIVHPDVGVGVVKNTQIVICLPAPMVRLKHCWQRILDGPTSRPTGICSLCKKKAVGGGMGEAISCALCGLVWHNRCQVPLKDYVFKPCSFVATCGDAVRGLLNPSTWPTPLRDQPEFYLCELCLSLHALG